MAGVVRSYRLYSVGGVNIRPDETIQLANQPSLLGMQVPDSKMWGTVDPQVPPHIRPYRIHHEKIRQQIGRVNDTYFTEYVAPFELEAYYWESDRILALAGGKEAVVSFVATLRDSGREYVPNVQGFAVDYSAFRPFVKIVTGAWFRFKEAQLRSSGHFGHHVDGTPEFQKGEATGTLTALYFPRTFEGYGELPLMVSKSGGIVLLKRVASLDMELAMVSEVYTFLKQHNAINIATPAKRGRKPAASASGQGWAPTPESLELGLEDQEESEH